MAVSVSITELIRHAEKLLPKEIEACMAAPDDAAPKGVFADWLDEQGERHLAWALRWMGRHGIRPDRLSDNLFAVCGHEIRSVNAESISRSSCASPSDWNGSSGKSRKPWSQPSEHSTASTSKRSPHPVH